MADLAAALTIAEKWVGEVPGVVMVGQGKDGIDVWVASGSQPPDLPETIQGVPVRVRVSGQIRPQ